MARDMKSKAGRPLKGGGPAISCRSVATGVSISWCDGRWTSDDDDVAATASAVASFASDLPLLEGGRSVSVHDEPILRAAAAMVYALGAVRWAAAVPAEFLEHLELDDEDDAFGGTSVESNDASEVIF